jgi:lysosomal acid lipase/cholesteryl ester hydrolase
MMEQITPAASRARSMMKDTQVAEFRFLTGDGVELMWTRFRRGAGASGHVVALIHGNTVASEQFYFHDHYNLVRFLLDHGHTELWCLDWRTSKRLSYTEQDQDWSCDDLALYDMPAAFDFLRQQISSKPVHVIAHCVGALAISMAIAAGLVESISSLSCHAVQLVARFQTTNTMKLAVADFVLGRLSGLKRIPIKAIDQVHAGQQATQLMAEKMQNGCSDPVCNLVNLIHSSTPNGLFEHAHTSEETHARLSEIFSDLPVSIYAHILEMNLKGVVVKSKSSKAGYEALPENYLASGAARFNFPVLFMAGTRNRVWFDSAELAYRYFSGLSKDHRHELLLVPGYGHMDFFWSPNAHFDVFPGILKFLDKHTH